MWRYFDQDGGQIVEHCNVMLGAIDSYMLPFKGKNAVEGRSQ